MLHYLEKSPTPCAGIAIQSGRPTVNLVSLPDWPDWPDWLLQSGAPIGPISPIGPDWLLQSGGPNWSQLDVAAVRHNVKEVMA